jgi:hypothetical protein
MVSQVQLEIQSMKPLSVPTDTFDFPSMALDIFFSMRLELMMFASAIAGYLFLFSSRVPNDVRMLKAKAKKYKETLDDSTDEPAESSLKNFESADAALQRAVKAGNNRLVLKLWNALKQFDQVPNVHLSQIVESLQCGSKDAHFIVRELTAFFKKHEKECNMCNVNDIFEALGKRLDSHTMGMILEMMPSLELKPDQRTYDSLLTMHATTRSFSEVQRLVAEMAEQKIDLSPSSTLAVIRGALQAGNFEEAHRHFSVLRASWNAGGRGETAWIVPRHVLAQLVELACREHQLPQLLSTLAGVPLAEDAINEMLSECIRLDDTEMARSVESLARAQYDTLPDSTYGLLIKGSAGRPWRMKAIVQEVLKRECAEFSSDLALSVLSFCSKSNNKDIADVLLERMKPTHLNVLTAFIRFYLESEQFPKACDVFEHHVLPLGEQDTQRSVMIDSRVERSLMSAALHCGRTAVVQRLFDSSRTDVAKHVIMIRKCAAENNLNGALSIFTSLKESGVEMNSIVQHYA